MARLSKASLLLIIAILAVPSLTMIEPTSAQVGITTPSTPNFAVNYEIYPIQIPPVYGVDPSTGKAVITEDGYTEFDETVFVKIVNQPFVPYYDSNGNNIQLFYNVRWKELSNNSWIYLAEKPQWTQTPNNLSEQTICTFNFMGNYHKVSEGLDIPIGGETDFQVEAYVGYYTADNVFVGKTSGWTGPQSIMHAANVGNYTTPIAPNTSNSSPKNPTAELNQLDPQSYSLFGLDWEQIAIIALGTMVVVLTFALVLKHRRNVKKTTKLSNVSVPQEL
jgi:hypothetical protein